MLIIWDYKEQSNLENFMNPFPLQLNQILHSPIIIMIIIKDLLLHYHQKILLIQNGISWFVCPSSSISAKGKCKKFIRSFVHLSINEQM